MKELKEFANLNLSISAGWCPATIFCANTVYSMKDVKNFRKKNIWADKLITRVVRNKLEVNVWAVAKLNKLQAHNNEE